MPVANVRSKWSAGNLIFYESVAGNGASVQFGEDGSGMDMKYFGSTASTFMHWDESADTLYLGQDDYGVDLKVFGDTASQYMMWDSSADALFLSGAKARFQLGAFSNTAGSGYSMANGTTALRVYADDGGSTSVTAASRAIWARLLLTVNAGDTTYDGLLGQAKLNANVMASADFTAGVRGYLELKGGNTVNTGGANANIGAGAFGVRSNISIDNDTTIATGHYIAGLHVGLSVASGKSITQTGKLVGVGIFADDQAGGATPTDKWGIGFYCHGKTADEGLRIGDFSGATYGSGIPLSATFTAAARVYADDGNASIGSGTFARAGVFRNLLTYTGGNREQEAGGVVGQVVSVAGTNRHNMAGTWGSYEVRTSLTVGGQAATMDVWVQAGLLARVTSATNIITIDTNGMLAGVASMSGVTTQLASNSGVYAAYYAGAWSGKANWGYGMYIEGPRVNRAIQIGELSSTAQTGLHMTSTNNAVINSFADDNNTALADDEYTNIWGRIMLFKTIPSGTIATVKGTLKSADAVDFGPGVYAGVQGYMELVDESDIRSGAKYWGVDSCFDVASGGTLLVLSGGIAAGFHAELRGLGTATQSSTAILAGLYIDEQITSGNWGYGIYSPSAAVNVGAYLRPTVKGMDISVSTVPSAGYGNSWKAYQASAKSDGLAGYFEGHMTGTSTGPTYALGAWMNVDSGTHGSHIYGLDVGVYASDAAYAGGVIVAANFFTYVSNNTSGPTVHAMFRFNTDISEDVPDYWFMAANPQSIALVDNADVAGTKIAAIAIQVSGSLADPGYIWVYDSTGA